MSGLDGGLMKEGSHPLPGSVTRVDVIVIGMGPAGASTAYELAQRGMSVLALEKQVHPRYKVCGGGLSARIERILPDDFKTVVEQTVHRIEFIYGGKESFFLEFPQPVAYMVMRARFDRWVGSKAIAAGVRVHQGESVIHLRMDEKGVEVHTDRGRYRAGYVVGADGVMSLVAQHLFPGRRFPTIPALESEYQGTPLPKAVHAIPTAVISLSAAQKGYGWVFPKKEGLSFGVGEFVKGKNRPRRSFERFVRNEKSLKGLFISSPLGHPLPLAYRPIRGNGNPWKGNLARERAVLVGDAGHLVDPLLGEGIYYAVRSGQLAAAAVSSAYHHSPAQLEQYEESIDREFSGEFDVAAKLNRIIYGLPRSVHRWAGLTFPHAYQRVLRGYCEVLQGRETYQGLWNRMTNRLKRPFAGRR